MKGTTKQIAVFLCFFLATAAMYANAEQEKSSSSDKARTSYAFGMIVGGDLLGAGMDIDFAAFLDGLQAAMEQKSTLITKDEAVALVQNAYIARLQKNEAAFLAQNAARPEVRTTESGLQYIVLTEGTGRKPTLDDTVFVRYEGTLTNGTVFDTSYQQEKPEEIALNSAIPGWVEALQLMNMGSKFQFYMPSSLAYGKDGIGEIIPPFSTLVFTIELVSIAGE